MLTSRNLKEKYSSNKWMWGAEFIRVVKDFFDKILETNHEISVTLFQTLRLSV